MPTPGWAPLDLPESLPSPSMDPDGLSLMSATIAPKDKFFYDFLRPWLGECCG